ncbi:MAG: phosphotransferase [Acidimicrobiales bacterium]
MSAIPLLTDPAAVTAEWLTDVLRASGALSTGRVVTVDHELFGAGMVGDNARFHLTYEGGTGPATIVGKFPTADEVSRNATTLTRTYEVESRFYQDLQARVDITTPATHLSLLDVEANEFVLIMEDLAPAQPGDQIEGCGLEAARVSVLELAKLHAPLWGDSALGEMVWLDRWTPDNETFYLQLLPMLHGGFNERYGTRLAPELRAAGDAVVARLSDYISYRPDPLTVVHGDYRLDNLLFDGASRVVAVDWQTVTRGPALTDVSYFLGTSPTPDVREVHEGAVVREYHDALVARGVTGYDWDRCWHDYRRFAFAGYLMAVGASMLVAPTDRGDLMFLAMAERSCRMALHHDTLSLL